MADDWRAQRRKRVGAQQEDLQRTEAYRRSCARKVCWTYSLVHYKRETNGTVRNGVVDRYPHSVGTWMADNWRAMPRAFAQSWLQLGNWKEERRVMALGNGCETVNAKGSLLGRIVAVVRMILFAPVTLVALGIKLVDMLACRDQWFRVAKAVCEAPLVVD